MRKRARKGFKSFRRFLASAHHSIDKGRTGPDLETKVGREFWLKYLATTTEARGVEATLLEE